MIKTLIRLSLIAISTLGFIAFEIEVFVTFFGESNAVYNYGETTLLGFFFYILFSCILLAIWIVIIFFIEISFIGVKSKLVKIIRND